MGHRFKCKTCHTTGTNFDAHQCPPGAHVAPKQGESFEVYQARAEKQAIAWRKANNVQ